MAKASSTILKVKGVGILDVFLILEQKLLGFHHNI